MSHRLLENGVFRLTFQLLQQLHTFVIQQVQLLLQHVRVGAGFEIVGFEIGNASQLNFVTFGRFSGDFLQLFLEGFLNRFPLSAFDVQFPFQRGDPGFQGVGDLSFFPLQRLDLGLKREGLAAQFGPLLFKT